MCGMMELIQVLGVKPHLCRVIKFWLVHISTHTLACSSWQVILATNVAESSVTIPGVSFVIDSCRSVEIYWDTVKQLHCSRLVWISQSQVTFMVV
jgi:hypothetical protein